MVDKLGETATRSGRAMANLAAILQDGPAQARFWAKVDVRSNDECWPWNGATDGNYGQFWWRGKLQRATCISWTIANNCGWPKGMYGCHTCDNQICVNPAHIWPGTQIENMQDMVAKGRGRAGGSGPRKFCPKGHAYEGENVVRLKDGWRKCAICAETSKAKYRDKIARAAQDADCHGENIPMVAVGLTKAQRAAIVGAQYREADGVWHPAGWYSNSDRRVRSNLSSKKLIHDYLRPWNRLTERGIAVRNHLISHEQARTALGNKETDRHG